LVQATLCLIGSQLPVLSGILNGAKFYCLHALADALGRRRLTISLPSAASVTIKKYVTAVFVTVFQMYVVSRLTQFKLEMRANAQRDGRPPNIGGVLC